MTAQFRTEQFSELTDLAVVAIGRNEGKRLERCLASALASCKRVVYVDSGSTDGSVEMARAKGATVIALDMSKPFTAARARNQGLNSILEDSSDVRFIQFVDGDCEIERDWLPEAYRFLNEHPKVAAVFGRRKERHPEKSAYNRLCDIEWDTPPGKVLYCGGDAMMRADALREVGGYRPDLIAGEEPELCVRLRQNGWSIISLARPMTLHDAAMTRFGQWWRRSVRSGHAFAEGAYLHGAPPERHWVRQARRTWIWGLGIPLMIGAVAIVSPLVALMLALIYPAQILRLFLKRRSNALPAPLLVSVFQVAGKTPEVIGQLKFLTNRILRRKGRLIEYK